MLDYPQLQALVAIHRRGAFDLAAADLGLTPSAISQRIKALEDRTGCLLLIRTHPVTATEAGMRLIRHAEEVALMETSLAADLALPLGEATALRLAINADSLSTWILPALATVPGFRYDIVIDDQNWSEDWLRRGEVAAAITGTPGPVQGCDSHALGALRYRATASPAFAARWFADGMTAQAFSRAPALAFNAKDRLQHDWATARTGQRIALPVHHLASSHGFVDAAKAGLGWCMNPEALAAPHLASGSLIDLGPPLDTPLYWQAARRTGAALAPLTRAIRAAAAAVLLPD